MFTKPSSLLQRGISLIELIMFIVIISAALAGILLVMNQVTGHSADPLIRKQALAIAESMLEEIQLQDLIRRFLHGDIGRECGAHRSELRVRLQRLSAPQRASGIFPPTRLCQDWVVTTSPVWL